MDFEQSFTIRPKMNTLSGEEVDSFYSAALEVLERIGIRVLHPEALGLLREAGATVSSDSLAKIRSTLVEKAVRSVPKRLVIYDREGKPSMELGGKNTGGMNTYYGTG